VRICLEVWGPDPVALVGLARHAETHRLDGVYLGESPTPLNAETWTTLGAIATATARIRLGPVIANLLPDYRSPILLARQGAALAALSNGRFDFRTGVGAGRTAGEGWWRPAGVRYPAYDARLDETERQLAILRRLWSGGETEDGYSLDLVHPPIEITVAASSPRSMGIAERLADRWETSFATPEEWTAQARRAGPVLASSLEIDGFIGSADDPDLAWRQVERDRSGEDLDAIRRRALVGSPASVAEQIAALAAAGVEQLVVALHDPHDLDAITRLGEAVRLHR
jgi:alkanesulfonate monooxygenase SsuD/methylene tetrahydromethanopterin reductase-like flavin-dependent oxidoreductase (luciferase family)